MNRFEKFKNDGADIWCRLFKISKETLDIVEGVMFDYTNSIVELRDKNYATVGRLEVGMPLQDTFNYVAFEHEVIGILSFHKFLRPLGNQDALQWVEVWSNGLVKSSYHLQLNFDSEPESGLSV